MPGQSGEPGMHGSCGVLAEGEALLPVSCEVVSCLMRFSISTPSQLLASGAHMLSPTVEVITWQVT